MLRVTLHTLRVYKHNYKNYASVEIHPKGVGPSHLHLACLSQLLAGPHWQLVLNFLDHFESAEKKLKHAFVPFPSKT